MLLLCKKGQKGVKIIKNQSNTLKIFIFPLIFSLAFVFTSLGAVSAVDGDVIYVNGSLGNDANDGFTADAPKLTIKNATGSVNPNGAIYIAKGLYSGINNTGINIDKNITINGESQTETVISGTGTNQIFNITSGAVVLIRNLTLANGNSSTGGAIVNNGTLTAENCTFTSNNAVWGGAIGNFANLNIVDCSFNNNTAEYGGSIINILFFSPDSIISTITNCVFNNNAAEYGGAIGNMIMSAPGSITNNVSNCSFINNSASPGGGAINNAVSIGGSVINTVNDCNFTNNTAIGYGGAISNGKDSDLIITNCNFTNNLAIDATGNGLATLGGAIANNGNLTVNNSTFTNNSVTGTNAYGGAINNMESTCTVTDSTFIENSAIYGGAIASISGSTWQSAISTIYNCTFTSNNADYGGAVANYLFVPLFGSGSGSVISTVTDCNFTENTATYHGGAMANICDPSTTGYVMSTVTGSNFTGNTAMDAAAISNVCTLALGNLTSTVNECTFYNNSATGTESYGGIISNICRLSGSVITSVVAGCDFTNNRVAWNGGAILNYVNGGFIDCSVTDCNFMNNIATIFGGAIFNGALCNLTVNNSNFTNNSARDGGAMATGGNSTVNNSNFINNTASGEGGAISNYWCNFITLHCNFIGNTANKGGAIYNYNSNGEIHFNRIVKNIANNGTALYCFNQTVNATNNWWGNNSNPLLINNFIYVDACSLYIDPWVILTVVADPTTINSGEKSTINADLNHINGGYPLIGGNIPDGVPVTFSCILGSVNPINTFTSNGEATTNFTSLTPGKSTVNTIVDDFTLSSVINIISSTNLNVTNVSGNYGDNVPLKAVLKDPMGNLVSGKIVEFYVNGLKVGENTTDVNGTATFNYKINQLYGNFSLEAFFNGEGGYLKSNTTGELYVPKADLYLIITGDKNNPSVGETFTLRYKLGNKGPDTADQVNITINLPKDFQLSQINGDGTWNYNKNTNTIIWTLSSVPVGDPNLFISGKNAEPGNHLFGGIISSATYNTNSEGVVALQVTTKSSTNNTALVNATKTLSMQHTGIPLNYLIMAILMVIGGLIIPKRK